MREKCKMERITNERTAEKEDFNDVNAISLKRDEN